jgi:thioredoxin reductase (NADPH)
VNVGCIPKKLFHISNQVKEGMLMAEDYGWGHKSEDLKHDWEVLRENIQNYIKGINFGYKKKLKEIGVDFIDARAKFKDPNTVAFEFGTDKQAHELKAKSFVIAAGVRPRQYENFPELKNWAITSDDLFSLKENPGKTLVIGGGYIAVECAGFLRGLGNEVILANRSNFLRVFDADMANKVVDQLEEEGILTKPNTVIKSVNKIGDKLFEVEL